MQNNNVRRDTMVSYQEFRDLDDNMKAEVLRELKEKYETNKEMGAAWGVPPLVVSNLYKKYVEGVRVGRRPKSEQEQAESNSTDQLEPVSELSQTKKRRGRRSSENASQANEIAQQQDEILPESDLKDMNKDFNLIINSQMSGEAAHKRFVAIADMFLKDKKYNVVLELKEI